MEPHLIKKAGKWFDRIEKWQAFLELSDAREKIFEHWYVEATTDLRDQWIKQENQAWEMTAWDNDRDTWWYLTEFGQNSVGVGFGWRYSWCLHSRGTFESRVALHNTLEKEKYTAIRNAFGTVHERGSFQGIALAQHQSFKFGSKDDRQMNLETLAWYAGHNRGEFLKQAIAKVNAFTNDPEITKLMIELNQEILHA